MIILIIIIGLDKRYFDRFHPVKYRTRKGNQRFSYMFEAAVLMFPSQRNGDFIAHLVKARCRDDENIDGRDRNKHMVKFSLTNIISYPS
jgi:hypothetical protein